MTDAGDPLSFDLKTLMLKRVNGCRDSQLETFWNEERFPLVLVNRFKPLYITDAATQKRLDSFLLQLNSVLDKNGRGRTLTHAAYAIRQPFALQEVLRLGADPDVLDHEHRPPGATNPPPEVSHELSAEILGRCRPSLKFGGGNLPNRCQSSFVVWQAVEAKRYPSLAQLAHDQHWYAVQNLSRPQVVSRREAVEDAYKGKSAIEWVRHHGPCKLEEEMMFLWKIDPEAVKPVKTEENCAGEIEQLKEMLVLNISKSNEEMADVRKKMAALEAENETRRRELGQQMNALVDDRVKQLTLERKNELEMLRSEFRGLRDHVTGVLPSIVASTVSAALAASSANRRGQNHQ